MTDDRDAGRHVLRDDRLRADDGAVSDTDVADERRAGACTGTTKIGELLTTRWGGGGKRERERERT